MNRRIARIAFAACAFAVVAVPTVALADPGQMIHMELNVKMQMPSMPISMPSHTTSTDICGPKQFELSNLHEMLQRSQDKRRNCTVSNFKIDGSSVSLHFSCTGDAQLEGDGTFTLRAGGGTQGSIHTSGSMHGQPLTMDFTYSYTPTGGACEYTPPKLAQ